MVTEEYARIVNGIFEFGSFDGRTFSEELRFWEDGRISGYHNDNEYSWQLFDDSKLIIYSKTGLVTHEFWQDTTNKNRWIGVFLLVVPNRKEFLIAQNTDYRSLEYSPARELMPFQKIGKHVYGKIDFLTTPYEEAKGKLEIGSFVSIGPNVKLIVRNHDYSQISTYNFMSTKTDFTWKNFGQNANLDHIYRSKTIIGSDVWIGQDVIITGGVNIGHGAVIGAGSIVTKNVPPYSIVAGNPAKVIKMRFNQNQISDLLSVSWWNWSDTKINSELTSLNDSDAIADFIWRNVKKNVSTNRNKWLINNVYESFKNALHPANLSIQRFAKKMNYNVLPYPELENFDERMENIQKNDVVMVTYPTFYSTIPSRLNYELNLVNKFKRKEVKLIGLVGDSMVLREESEFIDNEIKVLNQFDVLVVPNERMKIEFVNLGILTPVVIQGLYPIASNIKNKNIIKELTIKIIYAGNLDKAEFLEEIDLKKGTFIDVYGSAKYVDRLKNPGIKYHGSLEFNELEKVLADFNGFGIVWDGPSQPIKTALGRYTKFNYPYKASQYLSHGIPLIVWSGSAMASFVIENNLGVVLANMEQLEDKLLGLSSQELKQISAAAQVMKIRLKSGNGFIKAIYEAEGSLPD